MRYIPLKEASKDELEVWLQKSNEILEEMKNEPNDQKRKAIIHRNKAHWRDPGLLEFLKKLSDGKCWYTEARFTAEYPHLEHFRPKSCARNQNWEKCHKGYWWLAFDIENYRLSKPVPNTRKGTYFPLLDHDMAVRRPGVAVTRERPLFLDPANEDDAALIGFNSLGQPEPCKEPAIDLDEWDKHRIEFSIKHYGLDDQDLCDQRKALWISICAMFDEYAEFALKARREQCIESAGKAKQIKKELRKFLDPKIEFTGLIRDCFNAHKVGRALYPQLANHYLFEPIACTPESGWEKGQVENQVGNIREWLFTPLPHCADFAELNAWLARRCQELAARPHPEQTSRTTADCFEEERPLLMPIKVRFDGYVESMRRVSSQCLICIDRNRYSVPAQWANRVVSVRLTANRIRMVADGKVIAEHERRFGRDQLICDPWHYLPVLEKKPGALRHGAPFVTWDLPVSIKVVRDRILKQDKGDRAFVDLLLMARDLGETGLDALDVACDLTLQTGVISAAIVLNEMRRLTEAAQPKPLVETPASTPVLALEPVADCSRYDTLRSARHVH